MGQPKRPLRVIELITLLVIVALIVAVALPRCGTSDALPQPSVPSAPPNQTPPTSATPAP